MGAEVEAAIRAALEGDLAPSLLAIEDDSARHAGHPGARAGGHFRIRIVSESFRGLPRLERHRLVYRAVEPLMGRGIHALEIEARTREESIS